MNPPQFIYFDLGNVLLTFDHSIACRRLANTTGAHVNDIEQVIFRGGLQREYELGSISSEEFVQGIAAQLQVDLDPAVTLETCSDIFSFNAPIMPVAAHLATAGFRLGILSNTCRAHWEHIVAQRYAFVRDFFPIRVLSYEEKLMKPDADLYLAAARTADVPIEQIFFIDDRPENVAGARDAGMDAVQFQTVSRLIQDLAARGVRTNL